MTQQNDMLQTRNSHKDWGCDGPNTLVGRRTCETRQAANVQQYQVHEFVSVMISLHGPFSRGAIKQTVPKIREPRSTWCNRPRECGAPRVILRVGIGYKQITNEFNLHACEAVVLNYVQNNQNKSSQITNRHRNSIQIQTNSIGAEKFIIIFSSRIRWKVFMFSCALLGPLSWLAAHAAVPPIVRN